MIRNKAIHAESTQQHLSHNLSAIIINCSKSDIHTKKLLVLPFLLIRALSAFSLDNPIQHLWELGGAAGKWRKEQRCSVIAGRCEGISSALLRVGQVAAAITVLLCSSQCRSKQRANRQGHHQSSWSLSSSSYGPLPRHSKMISDEIK